MAGEIMKSVLEELYYAGEGICEIKGASEEYKKINNEFCDMFDSLLESLNDKQKEMLHKLYKMSGALESEAAITSFKAGFKLCMRLVFDGIGK